MKGTRRYTVARIEEIARLISQGRSDREIARTLRCRRTKAAEVRKQMERGERVLFCVTDPLSRAPDWTQGVDWEEAVRELGRGFEIKRIWEEKAQERTTYSNFWKYLSNRYGGLLMV